MARVLSSVNICVCWQTATSEWESTLLTPRIPQRVGHVSWDVDRLMFRHIFVFEVLFHLGFQIWLMLWMCFVD